MNILNPFKNLIETKQYPHARTYRTTFWGKVADTFLVFSGHLFPNYREKEPFKKIHFGIFDYFTLGIHFLLTTSLLSALRGASLPLLIPAGILTFLFNTPRLLFAAAMTFISLPFVSIAWAVTKEKGNKIKQDILSYEVQTTDYMLYFAPSTLPTELKNYKDCFFFIEGTNQLYYIDFACKPHTCSIKDIDIFRKEIGVDKLITFIKFGFGYQHKMIKQETLKSLTTAVPTLGSYHSLGEILKAQKVDLEDIAHATIELENDAIKISLTGEKKQPLVNFSLSTPKSTDLTLFKNMRCLNIGGIEELVEEKEEFSQLVTP
ncbi:hypothetical protein [Fluoribacter dumoffii]|uniref:Uncharacterized protein n=1 Tax=Fluoribacter dumoffii TaxID=463 RepID=A0A377GA22_9GAMM|nr:hypothetical protein [Fluoribacter dumoffii]KTC88931.1 hypothetical protein Ldum_3189 [Fluoribacter dumoffii NY 23]STO21665.1 Uncharacterised protein [Fluoribacter dumoffii]